MNIEDAFDLEKAHQLDTILTTEEADEFNRVIESLINSNTTENQTEEIQRIAMFSFIAGRNYQTDLAETIQLELQPQEAALYIQFLTALASGASE